MMHSQPAQPTPEPGWRRYGWIGAWLAFSSTFPPVGSMLLLGGIVLHQTALRGWIDQHLVLALVIYVTAFVVLAGLAVLPTAALATLAGWAFGFGLGFPAAVTGYMGAAVLGYAVSARLAGTRILDALDHRPRLRAVHQAMLTDGGTRTVLLIALLRLPPYFPFAPLNVLFAATRTRRRDYLLGSLLATLPRTGAWVFLMAGVARLDFKRPGDAWLMIGGIAATMLAVVIVSVWARRAIKRLIINANPPSVASPPGSTAHSTAHPPG